MLHTNNPPARRKFECIQAHSGSLLVKGFDNRGIPRYFFTNKDGEYESSAHSDTWERALVKWHNKPTDLPDELHQKVADISTFISKAIRLKQKPVKVIEREKRRVEGRIQCEQNKRPVAANPITMYAQPAGKFVSPGGATLAERCPQLVAMARQR